MLRLRSSSSVECFQKIDGFCSESLEEKLQTDWTALLDVARA